MAESRQHIRFCTTCDGVQIAYSTAGTGSPIVRVANWLTHLDMDWKSAIWSHWFNGFSRNHTLVRYDSRGCGLSDRTVNELDLDAWVRDLQAVVEDLGLDDFILMGHCQGGAISIAYAARYPEKVRKLILIDTYLCGALVEGAPDQLRQEAYALSKMIEVGWGLKNAAYRNVFVDLLMPEASEEERDWLSELERKSVRPETACRLWTAFHKIDIRKEAPKVKIPTLIFHVTGDAIIPFEEGRKLAGLIDHSQFIPLEGNNHILLKGEPAWQRFLAKALDFAGEGVVSIDSKEDGTEFKELTCREQEVLELLAHGLKNKQIAETLYISPKTVRNHLYRIFSKLHVESRAKALIMAREAGLGKNGVQSDQHNPG